MLVKPASTSRAIQTQQVAGDVPDDQEKLDIEGHGTFQLVGKRVWELVEQDAGPEDLDFESPSKKPRSPTICVMDAQPITPPGLVKNLDEAMAIAAAISKTPGTSTISYS